MSNEIKLNNKIDKYDFNILKKIYYGISLNYNEMERAEKLLYLMKEEFKKIKRFSK